MSDDVERSIALAQNLTRIMKEAGATMTIKTPVDEVTIGTPNGEIRMPLIPDGVSGHVSKDPTKKVFPPTDEDFEMYGEFQRDDALDAMKNGLIVRWPEFGPLKHCNVDIVWKRNGGKSGGKLTFGKCSKMSGLALFYSGETFVIWIAADHVRDHAFNQAQLEALIYHELSHCGWELDEKTGETKWSVVAHDVTTFLNEINRYGAWTPELQQLRNGYEQLALTEGQ